MTEQHARPSLWRLFTIWVSIGLQSFGGGASTTLLIQRTFIERTGWVTSEEFLSMWNLCQLMPGINLVGVTALLGKKLGGARGVVVSLAGMLAPSGAITCLLAAIFVQIERSATTQAVLRGVIPATGGIMILVLYNFAQPLISSGRKAGRAGLGKGALGVALILISAVLVIAFNVSAIVVLVGLAVLGAFIFSPRQRGDATSATPAAEPREEATR